MPNELQGLLMPKKKGNALQELSQGVSKGFWADGLGGPVDLITTLANLGIAGAGYAGHKSGLLSQPIPLIEKPVGGSDWIAEKMRSAGILGDNPGSTADNYGRVLGGLLSPVVQAKAPQIASAANAAPAVAKAGAYALGDRGAQMVENHLQRIGAQPAIIDSEALKAKYPGVDFWLNQRGDIATLDRVVVPKEMRGQGVGSEFMSDLVKAADADGARIGLTPSSDLGGNKARLTEFYKRYGFLPNKGKNRDFELMQGMVRQPALQKPAGLLDSAPVKPTAPAYAMEHRPVTVEGGAARLHDLEPSFGPDIYGKDAVQFFGTGDTALDRQTIALLKQVRGKPDAMVTAYRAVPADVTARAFNPGDWVTVNRNYAKMHGESTLGGDYKIIEQKVPASSLTTNADSFHEQGYYPQ